MKIGPYKVAYWNPAEPKSIFSKMFDSEAQAKQVGENLHKDGFIYTIMKIKVIAAESYTWELLEEGAGAHLPLLSQLYKYKSPLLFGAALLYLSQRNS